jgi:hypothetical protein
VPVRARCEISTYIYVDRMFVPAEQHLLASGKRDAANLLAELMFEWCVIPSVITLANRTRSNKGSLDPGPYALRGVLPFLSQHPANILPATTFLTRFLSLLSTPPASSSKAFIATLPSQTSFSPTDIHITTSPTLNFAQLALITVQRAPAVGVSGVQARGMDGGVGKDWENLVNRYRRLSGAKGVLGQKEVQEVL